MEKTGRFHVLRIVRLDRSGNRAGVHVGARQGGGGHNVNPRAFVVEIHGDGPCGRFTGRQIDRKGLRGKTARRNGEAIGSGRQFVDFVRRYPLRQKPSSRLSRRAHSDGGVHVRACRVLNDEFQAAVLVLRIKDC